MLVTIACINKLRSQRVARFCMREVSTHLDSFKARQQNDSVSLVLMSCSFNSSSLISWPSGASEHRISCTTSQVPEQIEIILLSKLSHFSSDTSSEFTKSIRLTRYLKILLQLL